MRLLTPVMSYGGAVTSVVIGLPARETASVGPPASADDGEPDWGTMTAEQKIEYNQRRLDRVIGV